MQPKRLANLVQKILDEYKAENIVVLPVKKITFITDYMIICDATSSRHTKSTADNLVMQLKERDIKPLGIEEDPVLGWTLVDLDSVIVHIMLPNTRNFYALEKLWAN